MTAVTCLTYRAQVRPILFTSGVVFKNTLIYLKTLTKQLKYMCHEDNFGICQKSIIAFEPTFSDTFVGDLHPYSLHFHFDIDKLLTSFTW